METIEKNEIILLLEKIFGSPDQVVRKEAELQLNLLDSQKNEIFNSLIIEIILSKNYKGYLFTEY